MQRNYVFKPKHAVTDGVIVYKDGFKIRSNADVSYFINKVMVSGTSLLITVAEGVEIHFSRNKDGVFSVGYRKGNLRDPFNSTIEIASSDVNNKAYERTANYYVWQWRKYLNNTVFRRAV